MKKTDIAGLFTLPNPTSVDQRGQFTKLYSEDVFSDLNIDFKIKQINISRTSEVGTIRGMHFQVLPYSEIKIIRCVRGKILDVIVDVRKESTTFLKYQTFEMSEVCGFSLYVPAGCAHGFQVLEGPAEVLYAHSEEYRPEYEARIHPLDPQLAINWPLNVSLISERDNGAAFIEETFRGNAS